MGAVFAALLGLAARIRAFASRDDVREQTRADVLVVLGARVFADGQPSAALVARVDHAARLFRLGVAPRIVVTGGSHDGAPREAPTMQRLLIERGVPVDVIVLEDQALSTRENAARVAYLLAHERPRLILITDGYHQLRARKWFRSCGLRPLVSPAPMRARSFRAKDPARWLVQETLAIARSPRLWWA